MNKSIMYVVQLADLLMAARRGHSPHTSAGQCALITSMGDNP